MSWVFIHIGYAGGKKTLFLHDLLQKWVPRSAVPPSPETQGILSPGAKGPGQAWRTRAGWDTDPDPHPGGLPGFLRPQKCQGPEGEGKVQQARRAGTRSKQTCRWGGSSVKRTGRGGGKSVLRRIGVKVTVIGEDASLARNGIGEIWKSEDTPCVSAFPKLRRN